MALKKYLIILLFLLAIGIVWGVDPYIKRSVNLPIEISIPCSFNGGPCPLGTMCNLTVRYPNTTLYLEQVNMTRQGDLFNYTMPNTSIPGDYPAYAICCGGSNVCDDDSFIIQITSVLTLNECPSTIPGILALGLLFAILFVMMGIAFIYKIGLLGMIASIGIIFLATIIIGCHVIVGWVVVGLGLFMVMFFAVQKWF